MASKRCTICNKKTSSANGMHVACRPKKPKRIKKISEKIRISGRPYARCTSNWMTHIRAGDFYIGDLCIPCFEETINDDKKERLHYTLSDKTLRRKREIELLGWLKVREEILGLVSWNLKRKEIDVKRAVIGFQCMEQSWDDRLDELREKRAKEYLEHA